MSEPHSDDVPETVLISCQPVTPKADPGDAAPTQRRTRIRWRCGLKAFCQLDSGQDDSGWWEAQLLDVSAVGLRLLTGRSLEPRSVLVIEPRTGPHGAPQRLIARVIHSSREHDGTWALGCQLASPLSDSQLRALLL